MLRHKLFDYLSKIYYLLFYYTKGWEEIKQYFKRITYILYMYNIYRMFDKIWNI